ncbi:MAG TPA: phenylalanine--tRNA ligase subunit beta [bacterium]|nr:phenylalanine--tRNA ligase subunit beta [bacterium]
MRYVYSLLREYLKGDFPPEELLHWLERLGLNPSVVETSPQDMVFEIEAPANRGDLLSLIGLARTIAPLAALKVSLPDINYQESITEKFPVNIEDTQDCPYYSCRIIRGIKIAPSPPDLRKKVEQSGFRSSLNVVDLSNLVMAETGQPLHVFDLSRLNAEVRVRRAQPGEVLITLDGRERKLDAETLVIADAEKPVALAGIMGGANSEVTGQTTDILVESALFAPHRVRRGSKRVGLTSEASLRFEKGLDRETVRYGLERLTCLIKDFADGQIGPVSWAGVAEPQPRIVRMNQEKLAALLGTNIPESFLKNLFHQLGISLSAEKGRYHLRIPSYRSDLEEEVDIIEEVARYWSYEKIPVSFPCPEIIPTPTSREYLLLEHLQELMARMGWVEVITSSLIPEDWAKLFNTDGVPLVNPISQSASHLRGSLVPGLLEAVRFNLHRGLEEMRLFEIGNVYQDSACPEELCLGLALCEAEDCFFLKGTVEVFLRECGVGKIEWVPLANSLAAPGGCLAVKGDGKALGQLLLPGKGLRDFFNLEKEKIAVAEIFPARLSQLIFSPKWFTEPSRFPASRRDFCFLFPEDIDWARVERLLWQLALPMEKITVFDIYHGEKNPPGTISVSFSVVFRHAEKTLTAEEIDRFSRLIIDSLQQNLPARLRQ